MHLQYSSVALVYCILICIKVDAQDQKNAKNERKNISIEEQYKAWFEGRVIGERDSTITDKLIVQQREEALVRDIAYKDELNRAAKEKDDKAKGIYIGPGDSTEADKEWGYLISKKTNPNREDNKHGRLGLLKSRYIIKLWELTQAPLAWKAGIDFWYKYPTDKRRYQWFADFRLSIWCFQNIDSAAHLQATGDVYDIPVDMAQWSQIKNEYAIIRDTYLKDPLVSNKDKQSLLVKDLRMYLEQQRYPDIRQYKKIDLQSIRKQLIALAPYYYNHLLDSNMIKISGKRADTLLMVLYVLLMRKKEYGLEFKDLQDFYQQLMKESAQIPNLQSAAQQKLNLLLLQERPVEFKWQTVDGRLIDIQELKGKIVLLDFWATWCKGCITGMPGLKKVYDQYKKDDFEVLSISIDPIANQDNVLKVHHQIGADWPLFIIGEQQGQNPKAAYWQKIWERYGFVGIPVYILLDRNGKLLEYGSELANTDNLVQILKKIVLLNKY